VARREASGTTDPSAWLALARAIVEHHEIAAAGNLAEAIDAARRAGREWPESDEPPLWEGLAQLRAGRPGRARPLLDRAAASKTLRKDLRERARAIRSASP
jgi:hypothetical protein